MSGELGIAGFLLISLLAIGGIGNLVAAAWLIWKKREVTRGLLHIAIVAVIFLLLTICP